MSRSALWRQEGKARERQQAADDAWDEALAEGKSRNGKNLVPLQVKDEPFNMNRVLVSNIKKSPYFLKLCGKTTWSQLVDEIYYKVDHLDLWSVGGKIPSSAYCILLRLFAMRISKKEMEQMLVHEDSPFIPGIGLLYLRYGADPEVVWDYFKLVMSNDTEIKTGQRGNSKMTLAEFGMSLLESSRKGFPRYSPGIDDMLQSKLDVEREKRDRKRHHLRQRNDSDFTRGADVIGLYEDEENPLQWYAAVIMEVLPDKRYRVKYTEYGNIEVIGLGEIDFPCKGKALTAGGDRRERDDYGRSYRDRSDYSHDYDRRGEGNRYHSHYKRREDDDRGDYSSRSNKRGRGFY